MIPVLNCSVIQLYTVDMDTLIFAFVFIWISTGCVSAQTLCEPNPCTNGGTCVNHGPAAYECECPPGFTGTHCEIVMGNCYPGCQNLGVCEGDPPKCTCKPAYTGDNCEWKLTCDPGDCKNGGTCSDGLCLCLPEYTGLFCTAPIEGPCDSSPCQNGGTCQSDGSCVCAPGFTGIQCESPIPCYPGCQNLGVCVGDPPTCACQPDYTGEHCEWPIGICDPECVNGVCFGENCRCDPGYTGESCETPIDGCVPECINGVCDKGECRCDTGYTGESCETPIGGCEPDGCQNGGTCFDNECLCPPTHTGPLCENPIQPGEGYDCDTNNPCTPQNPGTFFPFAGNCSLYIECVPDCLVRSCPPGLIWNPFEHTCTYPSEQYPCYTITYIDEPDEREETGFAKRKLSLKKKLTRKNQ